jgi:uncharacterized membrane protein YtjA (UPF0391 family)
LTTPRLSGGPLGHDLLGTGISDHLIIAAVFGFSGIAATASSIAQILFFVFLVIFLITLVTGVAGRRRPPPI